MFRSGSFKGHFFAYTNEGFFERFYTASPEISWCSLTELRRQRQFERVYDFIRASFDVPSNF